MRGLEGLSATSPTARTTSTSGMRGTGIEEVEAHEPVGPSRWPPPCRRCERLEVLDAKIVVGRAERIEGAPELVLELEALGDGFDDQVAVDEVVQVDREASGGSSAAVAAVAVELALLDQLVERLLDGPLALGEQAGSPRRAPRSGSPAVAATWAMPLPIWPQPRTPTREISVMRSHVLGWIGRRSDAGSARLSGIVRSGPSARIS